ncbi:MAG: LysM domain-containing protein [Myxococcota bacterium]
MVPLFAVAAADPGEVTLSLDAYRALAPAAAPSLAPDWAPISRTVQGAVRRGVFTGVVTTEVEVVGGPIAVPVAPAAVTLVSGTVDGSPAAFALVGEWQTVTVPPGRHTLRIGWVQGRDTDRYTRSLDLTLPPGPPTELTVTLPESGIDATLAGGVRTATRATADATELSAWLDAAGAVRLTWERRPEHAASTGEASVHTRVEAVVEVERDVVAGTARYTVEVRSGALDQVALSVPDGVEVLDVTGADVLQWRAEAAELQVLLRRVVEDRAVVTVTYLYPADDAKPAVRFPVPRGEMDGVVGIEAPVALELAVTDVAHGKVLDPRDVPPSVLELTTDPLSVVVAFDEVPTIAYTASPRPPVGSSTSRIEDLQAITVLSRDGTEVGKLRLTIRNTTRQVLTVDLPEGGHLTECFRDGVPLRPAADPTRPERTIVPLLRSERNARTEHVVAAGETLSAIAVATVGRAGGWAEIAAANPGVDPTRLAIGDRLVIPTGSGGDERSFVLEFGWERSTTGLGAVGHRAVALPAVDLPVMSADWHLYLPDEVEPLSLWTTLDRPDDPSPLARAVDAVVRSGAGGGAAWASTGYENSLVTRRSKWEAKQQLDPVGTYPFPLVGRKVAMSGQLLGTDPARVSVTWIAGWAADAARWGITALAAAAFGWASSRPREARRASLWPPACQPADWRAACRWRRGNARPRQWPRAATSHRRRPSRCHGCRPFRSP